ncbi:hypothetical protein PIB30_110739, partial [Stylosanthes scabra]|nr:hypothetical protein [Stylosanthes scabra]
AVTHMRGLVPIIPASAACLLTHKHKPPLSSTHRREHSRICVTTIFPSFSCPASLKIPLLKSYAYA